MILHFTKKLQDFDFLICFDLAKFETGVSLLNIKDLNNIKLENYYQISIDKKTEEPFGDFYNALGGLFSHIQAYIGDLSKVLVVREKQPSGFNVTTTISTLQALAGIHAILDVYVSALQLTEYEDGIHASSVKAWARKMTNIDKPQKEDIKKFLENKYPSLRKENATLDISDSVAVGQCLIDSKWNADIKDKIKELKKKIKELKLQVAKDKIEKTIEEYNNKLI